MSTPLRKEGETLLPMTSKNQGKVKRPGNPWATDTGGDYWGGKIAHAHDTAEQRKNPTIGGIAYKMNFSTEQVKNVGPLFGKWLQNPTQHFKIEELSDTTEAISERPSKRMKGATGYYHGKVDNISPQVRTEGSGITIGKDTYATNPYQKLKVRGVEQSKLSEPPVPMTGPDGGLNCKLSDATQLGIPIGLDDNPFRETAPRDNWVLLGFKEWKRSKCNGTYKKPDWLDGVKGWQRRAEDGSFANDNIPAVKGNNE